MEYATLTSGNVMVCGLSPIWTLPFTEVLVGVALVVRPMVARELARFMVVMAYGNCLFVKRVVPAVLKWGERNN
jgi:hypothetical protein